MRPKRKEDVVVGEAQQQTSTLTKKGRVKNDEQNEHKKAKASINGHVSSSEDSTGVLVQQQNNVEFMFGTLPSIIDHPFKATILICKRITIQQILLEGSQLLNSMLGIDISTNMIQSMYTDCASTKSLSVESTYIDHEQAVNHKLYIMVLPDTVSRSNHPWSVHSITDAIKSAVGNSCSSSRIIYCGAKIADHMGALAAAVARAFSVYTKKTKKSVAISNEPTPPTPKIHISYMTVDDSGIHEAIPSNDGDNLLHVCESIQLTARLVDMPPEELTTTAYADECRRIAESLDGVKYSEIVGEELNSKGYGGLFGIGKAATHPPRLVILEYCPSTYDESIALVGKGIVYDTGGLSLKSKDGMPGMKVDMGGSAGVFGGFIAAVKMKLPKRISLFLCLAENAIGPIAVRNDDILTLYSGKTVEVNNTDAEGRLVLADGVAHASKHVKDCTLIVDMATLTGAQLVAAGKTHAGILANTIEIEARAVQAGLRSGDLVVPLLYAPEILMKEFDSKVADMKNSVKDRSNAQASCAGHFIEAHIDENYTGGWLHVDMAGPADKDGRGTGYGVALVLSLLNAPGF